MKKSNVKKFKYGKDLVNTFTEMANCLKTDIRILDIIIANFLNETGFMIEGYELKNEKITLSLNDNFKADINKDLVCIVYK